MGEDRVIRDRRVTTIEGRRTLVVERVPPIPDHLQLLLEGGRDAAHRPWKAMRVRRRYPLLLGGTRADCGAQDHRLTRWLDGIHVGSDGRTRDLRLLCCQDCGSVCVRDVTLDWLPGLSTGGQGLRRRDHVIGWYSGSRRGARTYH